MGYKSGDELAMYDFSIDNRVKNRFTLKLKELVCLIKNYKVI